MKPLNVGVVGASGRMGRAIIRLMAEDPALRLGAAVTQPGDALLGQDAGAASGCPSTGVPFTLAIETPPDVLIDFSTPAGCAAWAAWCAERNVPLVSGTTGLDDSAKSALQSAARRIPLVWSANMSVGVNLLLLLAAETARLTGVEWDVEIVEAHHRHKVDAPSGTARALLAAIEQGRGAAPDDAAVYGRAGQCGPRRSGEIGVHAVRMGEVIGDHDVHFASPTEVLTLRHRALSRNTFAAGALRAARWVIGRPPGRYAMVDVLNA